MNISVAYVHQGQTKVGKIEAEDLLSAALKVRREFPESEIIPTLNCLNDDYVVTFLKDGTKFDCHLRATSIKAAFAQASNITGLFPLYARRTDSSEWYSEN